MTGSMSVVAMLLQKAFGQVHTFVMPLDSCTPAWKYLNVPKGFSSLPQASHDGSCPLCHLCILVFVVIRLADIRNCGEGGACHEVCR